MGTLSATWGDLVVGVDHHIVMIWVPPSGPFVPQNLPHAFAAIAGDPVGAAIGAALAPLISLVTQGKLSPPPGPVFVNGRPRLTTHDVSRNLTLLPHLPTPPGVFFATPPSGEGRHVFGNLSHSAGGGNVVRTMEPVVTCSDPVPSPLGRVLAIPKGPPVMSDGPSGINPGQVITQFIVGRIVRTTFGAISRLARFVGRLSSRRLRNIVPRELCTLTGHPIDVATGRVLTHGEDVFLLGAPPLLFRREYSSAWSGRLSPVGNGWSHSLDRAIWIEPLGIVCRLADGRELVFDCSAFNNELPPTDARLRDDVTGYELRRVGHSGWSLTTPEGTIETYEILEDEPSPTDRQSRLARCTRIESRGSENGIQLWWAQGLLGSAIDAAGREIRFHHDHHGQIARIELPHPADGQHVLHVSFEYDVDHNLVAVRDALGNVTRYEYVNGLLVQEIRRNGVRFFWGYDGIGADARCVRTWGLGTEERAQVVYHQQLDYDRRGRKTMRTDADGNCTVFEANELGLVVKIRDALGGLIERRYDGFRLVSETQAGGATTTYLHDDLGRLLSATGPGGSMTSISYDADLSRRITVTDLRGAQWTKEFDEHGNLRSLLGPEGMAAEWTRTKGRLTTSRSFGGVATHYLYDRRGCEAGVELPTGGTVSFEIDGHGNAIQAWLSSFNEPSRFLWSCQRDSLGRILMEKDAGGEMRRYTYDGEGNVLTIDDGRVQTRCSYAGFDWLASIETTGTRVSFNYHSEGELKEVRNELERVHSFRLDACRRVVEEKPFDVRTALRYKRDKAGRITEIVRQGRTGTTVSKTLISYDENGRVRRREHDDGRWDAFTYDKGGALISATNPDCTVTFTRDRAGRVVKETLSWQEEGTPQEEVTAAYDPDSRLISLASTAGARWQISRHPKSGLTESIHLGEDTSGPAIGMEWDSFGRERRRCLNNQQWEATRELDDAGNLVVQAVFGSDSKKKSLPFAQDDEEGASARSFARRYRWGAGGHLEAIEDPRFGVTSFGYDSRGRLAFEGRREKTTYRVLDEVGDVFRSKDRSDRSYKFGGMLRDSGDESFEYDLAGRMVKRQRGQSKSGWLYRWDGAGNLVAAVPLEGGKPIEKRATVFTYDALGRRVGRQTGRRRTKWIWFADEVLHEVHDGGVETWISDPDSVGFAGKIDAEGRVFVCVNDQIGSPTALYTAEGRAAWHQELDVFGVPRLLVDETYRPAGSLGTSSDWRWPGQQHDSETGLAYNRFRYYDPTLGVYLSPDPIGIEGGLAPYAYVPDPLTFIDPWGWLPWPALRPSGLGHHLVPRVKANSVQGLENLGSPTKTPTFYPTPEVEGLHEAMHRAQDVFLGSRRGPWTGSPQGLLDAVRAGLATLPNMRGDLRFPHNGPVLARNVAPVEAFEKLMEWHRAQPKGGTSECG